MYNLLSTVSLSSRGSSCIINYIYINASVNKHLEKFGAEFVSVVLGS